MASKAAGKRSPLPPVPPEEEDPKEGGGGEVHDDSVTAPKNGGVQATASSLVGGASTAMEGHGEETNQAPGVAEGGEEELGASIHDVATAPQSSL